MSQIVVEEYVPNNEVHSSRRNCVRSEYAEHVNWDECSRERVHTFIDNQLPNVYVFQQSYRCNNIELMQKLTMIE